MADGAGTATPRLCGGGAHVNGTLCIYRQHLAVLHGFILAVGRVL